jgi:predicted nucleotidyltransferase
MMSSDPWGLPNATIAAIRAVLARFPGVEKAVIYGSRAKGTHRDGSDIDLTLFGDHLTATTLGEIDEALDDLLLPYRFDLSLFAPIDHAPLREHIERVGAMFYERRRHTSETGEVVRAS